MFSNLESKWRNFASETRGSMSVEAVLAFPLLLWAMTATYTFFDVYKVQNTTYRANYTISDMLSRKTDAVNADYTDGLYKVFQYMTKVDPASSWIRVSVINCLDDCGTDDRVLEFDWSQGVNGALGRVDDDLLTMVDIIPIFSKGDRLILVETSSDYEPPFSAALTSFAARTIKTNVSTRPRFAPQLVWEGPGSGLDDAEDSPEGPGST